MGETWWGCSGAWGRPELGTGLEALCGISEWALLCFPLPSPPSPRRTCREGWLAFGPNTSQGCAPLQSYLPSVLASGPGLSSAISALPCTPPPSSSCHLPRDPKSLRQHGALPSFHGIRPASWVEGPVCLCFLLYPSEKVPPTNHHI